MCDNQRNLESAFAIIKGIWSPPLGLSQWKVFEDHESSAEHSDSQWFIILLHRRPGSAGSLTIRRCVCVTNTNLRSS